MNQRIAKRIRKSNRAQFPRTTETPEQYRADIRTLSKGNKTLITNGTLRLSQPKDRRTKRELRRGGFKHFPKGAVIRWKPNGKKFLSGSYFKVIIPKTDK